MRSSVKKVVTFRAASIGDGLLGRYFLENVHNAYPDATCYLVVSMRGDMVRSLLKDDPWIEVLEINRRKPLSIIKGIWKLWGTDRTLTQGVSGLGKFSTPSKLFARLVTKKGGLVGFQDTWKHNKKLYDRLLKSDGENAVFLNDKRVLEALNIPISVEKPRYRIKEDETILSRFSLKRGNYIVLHLFSGSDNRGLSPENMDRITEAISSHLKSTDTTLVLTGGANEADFLARLGRKHNVLSTAGKTTAEELGQLIWYAKAIVSVDTGAAHMASYLGKPLVVLCSYYSQNWWKKEQHTDKVRVLIGRRGEGESVRRNVMYPPSLNRVSTAQILHEVQEI